ncbi:MAG: hypothetical protein A2X64_05885 [Ignavibacteria bacterium GWF2_33_9]|nr:MAG: hypothetical protein A2X64_05885 [Ignavibacteria bacterium GWF2_33_9]
MKKFILLLTVLIFSANLQLYSQWVPPCDLGDCTGNWQERTDVLTIPSCPGCTVTIYSHFRLANCPNQNPTQQYQFHIDYFEGSSQCWNCFSPPNDTAFFGSVLRAYLFNLGIELQDADVFQVSFASCWSLDLYGPFPLMQPCPNNIYCCKEWYGAEDGIVWFIGDDNIDPPPGCQDWQGITCKYFCDPNGFLYKRTIDEQDLTDYLKCEIIPNPNNGVFELKINGDERGTLYIEIFDINGKLVSHSSFTKNSIDFRTQLSLYNISNGTYNYKISNDVQLLFTGKFVINK